MFCHSCGNSLEDGTAFCQFCGANQKASSRAGVAIAGSRLTKVAATEFESLTIAEKVVVVGAGIAAVCFFLPWASIPDLRVRANGIELMKYWGGIVFLILLPLVSVGIVWRFRRAAPTAKIFAAATNVAIGAVVGPQLLVSLLLVPLAGQALAAGAWGIGLGYTAILAGGFMQLGDIRRVLMATQRQANTTSSRSDDKAAGEGARPDTKRTAREVKQTKGGSPSS